MAVQDVILRDPGASGGVALSATTGGPQTLDVPLLTSGETFFAPSVSYPQTLTASAIVSTTGFPDSTKPFQGAIIPIEYAPMPHISRGKPIYGTGAYSKMNDGGYGYTAVTPGAWAAANGDWVAINVGSGPSDLLVAISNDESAIGGGSYLNTSFSAYRFQVSNDSTNGSDGTWTTVVTQSANTSMNREHKFSFTGYSWVKLICDTITGGQLDELDIWDASGGTPNTYAFLGDSLTVRGTLRYTYFGGGVQPSFQENLLTDTGQYPLQLNVGFSGYSASSWATNIASALALFPDAKYWCIGIGTNDGFSMPGAIATWRTDMQTVIDAVIADGRIPILARIPWTGATGYGGGAFDTCGLAYLNENGIEWLFQQYGAALRRGPDLYKLFYDNQVAYNVVADPHWNEDGTKAWAAAWADSLGLSTESWLQPPLLSSAATIFTPAIIKDAIAPPLLGPDTQVFAPFLSQTTPNNAVRFDALADTVRLSSLPGASFPVTYAGWFRPVVDQNNYTSIFALENAGAYNELVTEADGTTLAVYDHVTGSLGTVGTLTVGTWYRIAVVFTSGAWAAYIGTEGSATLTKVTGTISSIGSAPAAVWIGNTSGNEWANGRFARARVWTAALSDAEVEAEFHSETAVRTSNLLGEWFPRTVTAATATTAVTGADLISTGSASYTVEAGPLIVQQATAPLIASASTVYAATEVILGSTGATTLTAPLIGSTETLYGPVLANLNALATPLIGSGETLFGPSIGFGLSASLIGSTATLYGPNLTNVNVLTAPLVGSGETLFGPSIGFGLSVPLIGSSETLFAPSVAATVAPPLIGSTSALFAPSIGFALSAPLIGPSTTLFAPSLASAIAAPQIGSTAVLYSPALSNLNTLAAPLIGSGETFFSPTLTSALTLTAPLIGSGETLYAPVVGQFTSLSAPLIGSTETLYGPTLVAGAVAIQPPLIGSTETLYGPTLGQFTALTAPLIGSTETLFGPNVGFGLTASVIGSTATLFAPSLASSVVAPLIGSTSVVNPASLTNVSTLAAPVVGSTETFYSPTLTSALTITAPLIGSTTALYGPTVGQFTALAAPAIGSTATFFSPTLTSALTLTAPAIASTAALYEPSLTNVNTLTTPVIGSTAAVYGAIVTAGNLNLAAPVIGPDTQTFAPALSAGAVTLTAPVIASTSVVNPASLSKSNTLTAPVVSSTETFYSPALSNVNVLRPTSIASAVQFHSPNVSALLSAAFIPSGEVVHVPALSGNANISPPLIGSTETLYAPSFAADNTITATLITSALQFHTATIVLTLQTPSIPSTSQVFSPNLTVGAGWPVATTELPLIRALELPLPETLTRIVGIHQSDVIIRSALEAGLADLRANPFLLDYVFASLPQDVLTWREYGEKSLQAAKKWFLTTHVPVSLAPRLDESKWPQITIDLLESSEVVPEATLGDVNYEPTEQNGQNWPALTPQFTPKSFNASTGVVVLGATPEAWVGRGMFLVDKQGQAHEIVESISDVSFRISVAAGVIPDLRNCVLKSRRPSWNVDVESSSFKESYRIGIHTTDVVHLTWLHAIVQFALLRYKQVLLEARGFERSTLASSQVARDQGFETENLFSRFITVSGFVRQFWPKAISPVIDGVEMDNAGSGTGFAVSGLDADVSTALVEDPADQLWMGNLDTIRTSR